MSTKTVLGIDISKKKMDTLLILNDNPLKKTFDNTSKGHRMLDAWLRSLHVGQDVHICLEVLVFSFAVSASLSPRLCQTGVHNF